MKRLSEQTLYEILEVPPDASRGAIAKAVQRARALYGPGSLATYTLMSNEEAALLARRIDDAETTLLDDRSRARYDARLPGAAAPERPAVPVIPAVRMVPPPPREAEPAPAPMGLGGDRAEAQEGDDDAAPAAGGSTWGQGRAAGEPPGTGHPAASPPARSPILLSREVSAPTPRPASIPAVAPAPPASPPAPTPRAAAPAAPPVQAAVSDATSWTGEVLRRLREARGITLDQLSVRIKVTRHHIENIEADRFTALPAPVYLRGILLSVARELRLDGQKVARSYLDRVAAAGAQGPGPKQR